MLVYSHSAIFSVCGGLLSDGHFLHTIAANYIDYFSRSAAITAFGANVFAGAAGLFCSVPAFGERTKNIQQGNALDHLQVLPALRFNEVQQVNAGAGNCPTVLGVVLHFQPVRLGH